MSETLDPRGIQVVARALKTGTTEHLDRPRPAPPPQISSAEQRLIAVLSPGYWLPLREAAAAAAIGFPTALDAAKASPRIRRRTDPVHDRIYLSVRPDRTRGNR